MIKQHGFTLIELIMFLVIMSILVSAIFLPISTPLQKIPFLLQDTIAGQTAKTCLEWFIGQRRLNGYTSVACPSTSVPAFCSAPTGYNVGVNITCATINGDSGFATIVVTVSGKGNAVDSTLVANY